MGDEQSRPPLHDAFVAGEHLAFGDGNASWETLYYSRRVGKEAILGAASAQLPGSNGNRESYRAHLYVDGYPEGVQSEGHVRVPTATDYRGYGRQRRREARAALAALGHGPSTYSYTFLSFPDGGLCKLTRTYWSERRAAYRSPYTRFDRPPKAEILVPDTEYRGEDLTQELAQIIGDFRPTLILVPRKEDQHADHCAAWYFVADALSDVRRVHPDYDVDLLNYIIHFNAWPFEDDELRLEPPPGLRGGTSGWMSFRLTPAELRTKRAALRRYESQMHAMDWFLAGFARSNEVFSRPVITQVVLPSRRNLCCDQ